MPAEKRGHIKIARKAFADDKWWREKRVFSKWEAWEDMIQLAQWEAREFTSTKFGTIRLERGALRMTVTEFQAPMELRSLSVGQLGEVRIAAEDIDWNGYTLQRAHAVLHNVHFRPTAPPVMVAAPVEVSVELTPEVVDELFTRFVPRVTGQLSADGSATLHWAAHPGVVSVEAVPHIDGSTLWLRPRAIIVRERRWALPRRVPPYPIRLPKLPNGLKLELTPRGDGFHVIGTLPEWNVEVPRGRLEKLLDQLDAAGRQPVLTWWGR